MPPIAIPAVVKVALGAIGAAAVVHWVVKEVRRINEELDRLKEEYEGAMARGVILNESAEMLITTARVMSEDLEVWQALYGRKRLALPA